MCLRLCKTRRPILWLWAALLVLGPLPVSAQIVVNPALPTPQTSVVLAAVPPAAGSYRFRLRTAGAILLQSNVVFTGADGSVRASIALGSTAPGSYTLTLDDNSNGAQVASQPFTVGVPLSVTATPDSLRPGDALDLALGNLRPLPTRVRIDGVSVFGPELLEAGAANASVTVTVPAATPTGGTSSLRVEQVDGSQVVAVGTGSVRVLDPGFTGDARLLAFSGLPASVQVGERFTVSGRLELRQGSPAGLRAGMVLRLPDGRSVPLEEAPAIVAADGSFSVDARVRSIWNGAPVVLGASGQGQTDIVFTEPDRPSPRQPRRSGLGIPVGPITVGSEEPPAQLRVRLRTPDGQPIPGAVVTIDGRVGSIQSGGAADAVLAKAPGTATSSPAMLIRNPAQLAPALQQSNTALLEQLLGQCPVTLWRGITDANGEVTISISFTEMVATLVRHSVPEFADGNPSGAANRPIEVFMLMRASGLTVGFTAGDNGAIAQGIEYPLIYRFASQTWCGGETGEYLECDRVLGFNPLLNYTLRPYTGNINLPIDPDIGGLPRVVDAQGRATWGPVTTFPGGEFNDVLGLGSQPGNLPVRFTLDQGLFGAVRGAVLSKFQRQPNGLWVEQTLGEFPVDRSEACAGPGDTEFQVDLPGFHRAPWGTERYRIRIQGTPDSSFGEYRFSLETQPPPAWWRETPPDMISRTLAQWQPERAELQMRIRPQPVAVTATPPQDMPSLSNASQGEDVLSSLVRADGQTSLTRTSRSDNEVVNEDTEPRNKMQSGLAYEEQIGPERILDTGWFPLFRFAWGVPPIAAATFGIDARFWADLLVTLRAELDLQTGRLSSLLRTVPSVGGAIDAFFNFSAVLGLVDMTASFTPSFGVAMPVTLVDGELDPAQSEPCFAFRMRVAYDVSVGLCPLCVEFGDIATPINEREPNASCEVSLGKSAGRKLAALGITRLTPPSAAFDALGQGGLVEASNGRLLYRPWQGGSFASAVDLGVEVGASGPQIAFHAPGQALLVHERSSLGEAAFRASSISAAAASRHLVFRRLVNGSWSAAQALTPPASGGEGQVSLAVCPAGQTGCPSGGEVLAVWTRNAGSDVFGFQFEVWHAFFRNGAWTAPARLADPGSGSDMHARATYLGSVPMVSFTRADGRSLPAQAQRRLMYRLLPDGAALPVLGAPQGVVWQSLASDGQGRPVLAFTATREGAAQIGNQAELWGAEGVCSSNTCSFTSQRQTDALGRAIRAESPALLRTASGSLQVAFRGLGFGPSPQGVRVAPGDPLGVLAGTGSLMLLPPRFDALPTSVQTLGDGAGLWMNPLLVQHPVSQSLLALADVSSLPVFDVEALAKSVAFDPYRPGLKSTPVSGSLQMLSLPDAPDFAVEAVLPVDMRLQPGASQSVQVALRTGGRPWLGINGGETLQVEAAWDAPPGVGEPAGSAQLGSFDAGGRALLDLQISVPGHFHADETRRLFVRVGLPGGAADLDPGNDLGSVDIGALAVPGLPEVVVRPRDRHALLSWEAVEDDRVTGYRIWRAEPADSGQPMDWIPVGSSFEPAFIDFTGEEGATHWYRVSSLSARGVESAPGPAAVAVRDARLPADILADGFEDRSLPFASSGTPRVLQPPEP